MEKEQKKEKNVEEKKEKDAKDKEKASEQAIGFGLQNLCCI